MTEYDFANAIISDAQNIYQTFLNSERSSVDYGKFRDAIGNMILKLNNQCYEVDINCDCDVYEDNCCEVNINCDCDVYNDNIIASLNQILDDGMFVYSLTRDFGGW